MSEQWKAIPGYEGVYEVSDQGRVRSLERTFLRHGYPVRVRERILRAALNPSGYHHVMLYRNGDHKSFMVHRLVHMAFNGEIEDGLVINHKDGQRLNNSPSNLEVVTPSQNIRHAYDVLGFRAAHGEQCSHLTEAQAREIKKLALRGELRQREIARMFGISQGCVTDIKCGRRWKYLAAEEAA